MAGGLLSIMLLPKRVIVPLDGSKLAESAIPYAEEIGERTGSDIVLLSVLEFADDKYRAYLQKKVNVTKSHVKQYSMENESKEVEVYTITREGYPAEVIVDFAGKWGNSMIVMATHGRSGIGRWALGSVADKVVRAAINSPIMLVRGKKASPNVTKKRLEKALVPLDGSKPSQVIVPYITQMATKLDLELTLFHVLREDSYDQAYAGSYLQSQCAEIEQQCKSADYLIKDGSPAEAIIDLADELAVDFIAMSTRGKNGFTPWTIGSVAQKVLLGGNTPLLLVRYG
jgi:nucleotide-binding universal stress UspA family protein